jgi:hypothetical protein
VSSFPLRAERWSVSQPNDAGPWCVRWLVRLTATVHRRGYRFIAPVNLVAPGDTRHQVPPSGTTSLPNTASLSHTSSAQAPNSLPERDDVLHRLQTALAQARVGAHQVVFVTGESGIGKTAVVEAFLAQAAQDHHLWISQGQCIEHYGVGEPISQC